MGVEICYWCATRRLQIGSNPNKKYIIFGWIFALWGGLTLTYRLHFSLVKLMKYYKVETRRARGKYTKEFHNHIAKIVLKSL